ncbi:NADH-quinone oxidoreductase subunit N [Vulgatibacter incomptus]|uniref:NADH-quinone oxidoreductase subunit N n=1 Tax=Vulgatibacter incomptus TaxID=1391653 RepID=A0A0K1P810_9BACT|nr:NADH-quinone oxidoreductase subunit N [Vulgatibacter incomptus]AKU89673.1 NADH-ubiquinone oxidoreductase chain N [Vulgatibacter incomptus]
MPQFSSADLLALAPALVLTAGALVLLMLEVFQDSDKRGYQAWFTAAVAGLAGLTALPMLGADPHPIVAVAGRAPFAVADNFGAFIALIVCAGLAISSLVAGSFLHARNANRGEYYALAMFGAVGMVLLGQGTDLLFIFVAIEIMSVSTYALAAFLRRGAKPAEAAFKYFLLGAFSTAIYLYGAALVYGATGGKTALADIANASGGGLLLAAGLCLVSVGFLFKVAAAPFHMWTPDVYEGAPTPVTAFMAVGVKAAAFAALVRVLTIGFGGETLASPETGWGNVVGVLALATMLVGNLLAVPQRSVKRLLAYSSIAHAGYLLLGVAAAAVPSVRAVAGEGILYYLAAYTFTGVGAFAVVAAIERLDGEGPMTWDLDRFAGLAKRRPAMALAMALFMMSLAGIPPTAGFIGKLYIFRAAIDAKLYGLAVAGVLTSVVGVYYYLRVVVYMYMREQEGVQHPIPESRPAMAVALAAAAIGTVLLGILPSLIGDAASASALVLGG